MPSFCIMLLISLLMGGLSAAAQDTNDDLPPLINVAVVADGSVAFFYPDGWLVSVDDGLQLRQDVPDSIQLSAETVDTGILEAELLPDWIIAEALIPEDAFLSIMDFGTAEGWIAQGVDLLQADVFSALIVIPVMDGQVIVIQADLPAAELAQAAPLITAMLEKIVILPGRLSSVGLPLHLNLPLDWVIEDSVQRFQAATSATALRGDTLTDQDFLIDVSLVSPEDVPADTAEQQVRDFEANGQPARMYLTADRVTGGGQLVMVRQWDATQFLVMRIAANSPDALVGSLPMLQGIFASIKPTIAE